MFYHMLIIQIPYLLVNILRILQYFGKQIYLLFEFKWGPPNLPNFWNLLFHYSIFRLHYLPKVSPYVLMKLFSWHDPDLMTCVHWIIKTAKCQHLKNTLCVEWCLSTTYCDNTTSRKPTAQHKAFSFLLNPKLNKMLYRNFPRKIQGCAVITPGITRNPLTHEFPSKQNQNYLSLMPLYTWMRCLLLLLLQDLFSLLNWWLYVVTF